MVIGNWVIYLFPSHQSPVPSHQSPVTSPQSPVTCHLTIKEHQH
ncbi:hypothetical protein [Sphaerospermopsis reniformis]|nr:hypothetical protein [Sphaerospermopsis reniformis]